MKHWKRVILIIVFFSIELTVAQISPSDTSREAITFRLKNMLTEREKIFNKYFEQIERRTGIFGNQTKRDIKSANEILESVVKNDNIIFKELEKLVRALERKVETRQYENINIGYDKMAIEARLNEYEENTQKLSKSLRAKKSENDFLQMQNKRYKFYTYLWGILTLIFLILTIFLFFRMRRI